MIAAHTRTGSTKTSRRSVVARIEEHNRRREPERLLIKYKKMGVSPFAFFRGTCHLFCEDWPADHRLNEAPEGWVCGDLHLENFGAYQGRYGTRRFDIGDFDEAARAPVTCDLARFVCGLLVGAQDSRMDDRIAVKLAKRFLAAYAATLAAGHMGAIGVKAGGLIGDLLAEMKAWKHKKFLDERTRRGGHDRKIRLREDKTLEAGDAEHRKVVRLLAHFAEREPDPDFYRVLDVARRVTGTGSLGVERYVVLVAGEGGRDGQHLLDLKETLPSAVGRWIAPTQPRWPSEAVRAATLQQRMQGVPPRLVGTIDRDGKSFLLRELQPAEDRIDLAAARGNTGKLAAAMADLGNVVAWAHLRAAGWRGAASVSDLGRFGRVQPWRQQVIRYALAYRRTVADDHQEYRRGLPDLLRRTKKKTRHR